ncbi:MAG: hypothetical protein ABL977_10180 [Candidatus Eisenbacteria bacterium]
MTELGAQGGGPGGAHRSGTVALRDVLARALPRLLTQLCRDPDHPLHGCFDRHHWHYKMRDFSSAVLVQGSLVLDLIARRRLDLPVPELDPVRAAAWREAALRHWVGTQHADGSLDEYYPAESGFPAAGFSLYAAAVLAQAQPPSAEVAAGMTKTAAWILRAAETEAVNQEIIALSACTLAAKAGIALDGAALERRWAAVHAGQSPEGWFEEYGGADTGYLAVACDALWDVWEATGDVRARDGGLRAVGYIHALLGVAGDVPRYVNSRNTDYLSGYGLVRFASLSPEAAAVVHASLAHLASARHFLHHIDDRYLAHYVHTSWFRALPHLADMLAPGALAQGARWFPHARMLVVHDAQASLYVAAGKGGTVVRVTQAGELECDQGWRGSVAGVPTTTCWQESAAEVSAQADGEAWVVRTAMPLRQHRFLVPSPLKHLVLRVLGAVAGRALIPLLKRRLIFSQVPNGARFEREVRVQGGAAWIRDTFAGRPLAERRREGAYSLRHVSSGGSFSFAELAPVPAVAHLHRDGDPV